MSEAKDRSEIAPVVDESEGKDAGSPVVNGDNGDNGDHGDHGGNGDNGDGDNADNGIYPVMSYEPGTDLIEPVISEGEIKYEGKGKGRTESFSHLPTPGESAPSTAPSTRPTSQAQADSTPSTAPSTRPVSQSQAEPGPSTAEDASPVSKGEGGSAATTAQNDSDADTLQDDSASVTDQGTSAANAAQGDSGPVSDQGDSSANAAQDTKSNVNYQLRYDCGCRDIFDHTGKKRQQACDEHKINPNRAILPLPPKKPLGESTNLHIGTRKLSIYASQAQRNEQSPPRQAPVMIPTKGRNFVQGSENGPTFLDPFNSERAIEPTGPPNSLTTTPTAEAPMLEKIQVAGEKPRPVVSDPKAPNPTPNPPQTREGASRSQETQPEVWDALEGQGPGPNVPMDEQNEGDKAATRPKHGEGSEGEDSDEHHQLFTGRESNKSTYTPSTPAHRNPDAQPKSILKKTVGTTAEARQAEKSKSAPEQVSDDDESEDPTAGPKLFQESAKRLKGNSAAKRASAPVHEIQGGVRVPPIRLHKDDGLVEEARTNSKDEPAFPPPPDSENSDDDCSRRVGKICPSKCGLM